MKIMSWNINALRAHKTAFRKVIRQEQPDIFFCRRSVHAKTELTFAWKVISHT